MTASMVQADEEPVAFSGKYLCVYNLAMKTRLPWGTQRKRNKKEKPIITAPLRKRLISMTNDVVILLSMVLAGKCVVLSSSVIWSSNLRSGHFLNFSLWSLGSWTWNS